MPRYSPYMILICLLLFLQTTGYSDSGGDPDRERIETRLEAAYFLVESDSRLALWWSQEILHEIVGCGWKDLEAKAYHNIGRANWNLTRYDSCQLAHAQSLFIRQELEDSLGMARSLNNLGQVAVRIGEYKTAEGFFKESINLRVSLGKTKEVVYSLVSSAELKAKMGETDSARSKFLQASRQAEDLQDSVVIAFVEERWALFFIEQKEYKESEEHFEKSLAFLDGNANNRNTSWVLLGKLECELQLGTGNQQEIANKVQRILENADSQDWLPVEERGYYLLMNINQHLGNHEQELKCRRKYQDTQEKIKEATQALIGSKTELENVLHEFLQRKRKAGKNGFWKTAFEVVLVLILFLFMGGTVIYTRYIKMKLDRNRFKSGQEEAEAKTHQLREFTTTVAHDIKEPIRSVSYFLDLLKRENLIQGQPFMNEMYVEAKTQVDDLDHFLKDLEDYFGLSGGKMEMELVDLNEVIRTITLRLKSRIVETNTELDIGKMPIVYSQPTLLKLIIQNLVSNAIKFQPEGNRPEIQIGANLTREKLAISVKDNGIGIPEKHHSGIFHALNRGNAYSYPGTGMGLAIVVKAVSILKGSISVHSNPENGTGTIFLIDLPLIQEPYSTSNQYLSVESFG